MKKRNQKFDLNFLDLTSISACNIKILSALGVTFILIFILFVALICFSMMTLLSVYFNTTWIIIMFDFHLVQAKTVFRFYFLRLIVANFYFQYRFADFYLRSIFNFFWFTLISGFIFLSEIIEWYPCSICTLSNHVSVFELPFTIPVFAFKNQNSSHFFKNKLENNLRIIDSRLFSGDRINIYLYRAFLWPTYLESLFHSLLIQQK